MPVKNLPSIEAPKHSYCGLCADLGPAPSAEEIDAARAEAWAGFGESEDFHRAIFPDGPNQPRSVEEMDEGIGRHLSAKFLALSKLKP